MNVFLLLAEPRDASIAARMVGLGIRLLQTDAGGADISVTFQPNRSDELHASAKAGAQLAYRILFREGIVRSQQVVRCQVQDAPDNVVGRSADLAFSLAILSQAYEGRTETPAYAQLAATGVLEPDGSVRRVDHVAAKLRAALQNFAAGTGIVFFPAENAADPDVAGLLAQKTAVELVPVGHIEEALERLGIVLERVWLRNPFRGLESFDYEHRAIFFGRDAEVGDLLSQLLRRERAGTPGVLVEGPSGSGKSSFLRAGLLPAMVDPRHYGRDVQDSLRLRPVSPGVRHAIWRPGLLASGVDEAGIVRSIRQCWAALREWPGDTGLDAALRLDDLAGSRRTHWPTTKRFVWVVDQFEELFTLSLADDMLEQFGRFLTTLQADGVWTLASIRTDALPQLKRHEKLRHLFGVDEGQYYLPTVRGVALDAVIDSPARAADLTFGRSPDGRRVDQLLREEAYRESDSLPLLQFTLNELYLQRVDRELTHDAYQRLAGLSGSIASTARTVLDAAPDAARSVPRLFRTLISVDEDGSATRRRASASEFANDAVQRELVSRLVAARLCTTDRCGDEPSVAFTHDSLLRTLPAIAAWLQQEGALLQTRELAVRDAQLWRQHGESGAWLAASDKLLALKALTDADIPLTPVVQRFIERSHQQRTRNFRIRRAAVAVIAVLAVVACIGAWIASSKQREAAREAADARHAELQLLTEAATEHLKDGELSLAQGIILEVFRRQPDAESPDPASVNILEEIRAADPARAILAGHSGPVRRLEYAADGRRIVTASLDGTARIWDARTGVQLLVLPANLHKPHNPGYFNIVKTAVFSPDGSHVLTASGNGTAGVWDAESGAAILTLSDHLEDLQAAAYSPDGRLIAAGYRGGVRVISASSGVGVRDLAGPTGTPSSVEFSPDGTRIAAALDDGTVRVWRMPTGEPLRVLTGHQASVLTAVFSPDGARILTASDDRTARIWDARTGRELLTLSGHRDSVTGAVFSPNGRLVATVSRDTTVRIWNAATGAQLRLITGHVEAIGGVAFSPDSRHVASGGWDRTGRVWDLQEGGDPIATVRHDERVVRVRFSPDGQRLLSSSIDRTTIVSTASNGARLSAFTDEEAGGRASFSPDGQRIMTFNANGLRIRDGSTGAVLVTIGPRGNDLDRYSAAYSRDGRYIVESFDNFGIRVLDALTGAPIRESEPIHRDFITSAEYSPDGRRLVTGSVDSTARISDASTFAPIAILPHGGRVMRAIYSPDGRFIVTAASDSLAHVWDARTGKEVRTLAGHHAPVTCVALSTDSHRIATGSDDGTARLWDTDTGFELAVIAGGLGGVRDVSFSPDGLRIATASTDNTARSWDARVPASLRTQVLWAEAADADPLSSAQRSGLGLPSTMALLANSALRAGRTHDEAQTEPESRASACGRAAASYYDPDRLAPGLDLADVDAGFAVDACKAAVAHDDASDQDHYQAGRALWAAEDFAGARRQFELALSRGYRVAGVDLGLLLTDPLADMPDAPRAAELFRQAWDAGVPIAGFELAAVLERGARVDSDPAVTSSVGAEKAWAWYETAARQGEPHALARLGERAERAMLDHPGEAAERQLEAFTYYARAAERARVEKWPDTVVHAWRYRRATLARLLADDHRMADVARVYATVTGQQLP